jgi:hypothetical protein
LVIELNDRGVERKAETADQARIREWKAPNLIPSPAPMRKTNEGRLETSIRRHLLVLVSQIVIEGSLRLCRGHGMPASAAAREASCFARGTHPSLNLSY